MLADDSGISVEALGFAPGIYSARFSGVGASDEQNRVKLIAELNARGVEQSSAFYTAAIALVGYFGGEAVLGGGEAKPCRRVCEGGDARLYARTRHQLATRHKRLWLRPAVCAKWF